MHAPKSSPLREIQLSELAEYMLNLTNTAALPEACAARGGTAVELAAGIHERLGVVLLNEVLSEPESVEARAFCKALNALNLVPPELAEGSAEAQASVDTESLATLSVLATNAGAVVVSHHSFALPLNCLDIAFKMSSTQPICKQPPPNVSVSSGWMGLIGCFFGLHCRRTGLRRRR